MRFSLLWETRMSVWYTSNPDNELTLNNVKQGVGMGLNRSVLCLKYKKLICGT